MTHFNLFSCWFFSLWDAYLTVTSRVLLNSKVFPHFQIHCVWTYGAHTQTLQYTLEWPWGSIDACRQPIFSNIYTLTPIPETLEQHFGVWLKKRSLSPVRGQTDGGMRKITTRANCSESKLFGVKPSSLGSHEPKAFLSYSKWGFEITWKWKCFELARLFVQTPPNPNVEQVVTRK